MRKTLIAFLAGCLTCGIYTSLQAQSYNTGLGIRLGETSGFTVKHFIRPDRALEGIVGFWPIGTSITGLYEVHTNAFDVQGLNWYYGGGGHIRFYSPRKYCHPIWGCRDYERGAGIGIDGILGLEYEIGDIPFTIAFDLKPYIEFITFGRPPFGIGPGFSIRYVF